MNIERKIHFKAAGLYIIVGIFTMLILLFLYNLRLNIIGQRQGIEKQHRTFTLTNELIYAVNDAQAMVNLFFTTNDAVYVSQFDKKLHSIDSLIDILVVVEPVDKTKLIQISRLLTLQAANVSELNRQLGNGNPLDALSKHIRSVRPEKIENSHVVTTQKDTLFKTSGSKKGFFKRLKYVFSPQKDCTVVVSTKQIDTLRLANVNTIPMLSEVEKMASTASKSYEKSISLLGKKISQLIISDREISAQISGLLLHLHSQTLNSVLDTINRSEESINRNYLFSILGGMFALGLILLFVVLIIFDVNKGREAREKIQQVLSSRHQLLLSVSHDVKSPLGSILGYLEIHKKEGVDMTSMQNSARHILALLENLLEFSSLEQGSLNVSYADFSLREAGDEIGQMFIPLSKAKELLFNFKSDDVRVNSDQIKIKQIVINLVSNAIKYTRVGEVELQLLFQSNELIIKVKDTGVGMSSDDVEVVFEPFRRVESNNSLATGTGLGMYVVKGLVELLGGSIDLKSEVGSGTEVVVTIPCSSAKSEIKNGVKKIAVYDDEPAILAMTISMLKQLGHEVVERDYDIVLTDLDMGELSGVDVLASVVDIPVIVMTGQTGFTLDKARKLGFDGYLSKPFTLNDLREMFGEIKTDDNDFFGDDYEEILEMFRNSTRENMSILRQALSESDFNKAQAVCHKMLPMFAQLGYSVIELQRMDLNRGNVYNGWEIDVEAILNITV